MSSREVKIAWYSPLQVPAIWGEVAHLFERVVEKAVHGEFDVDDLQRLAVNGEIVIGIVRTDGEVLMAIAYELRHYPKALAVNILAMGGAELFNIVEWFFPSFTNYCREIGADWIECSVSPGMERMHMRNGLRTVYRNMRYDL